jgi:hypothetical protein
LLSLDAGQPDFRDVDLAIDPMRAFLSDLEFSVR